jgi:2-(1,2-epoxy-1,2-dihydrophenyl)acetyl-CoA isomerase
MILPEALRPGAMPLTETSPPPALLQELADGILRLTLNRPHAANAIEPGQRDALIAALQEADRNPAIRVVTLSATGKHFCSGADITSFGGPLALGDAMRRIRDGAQRLICALLDCSKPVVASVQGTAAGLGAHVVFACDFVLTSENASFLEPFVHRGITLDAGGAYLLARNIGLQRAKELVFLGDRLSAADAAVLGLVNRVVPSSDLADATDAIARRLAAGPTVAIGFAKLQLNRALDSDRATTFLTEAMAQELVSRSEDVREGLGAFAERRVPQFKGV